MNNQQEPRIEINEPCSKGWSELEGAGAKRFCDACALHVVDGSALTQAEAENLVAESEERVCMRLELDDAGRPVHVTEGMRARARAKLLGIGLAGALAACADETPAPDSGPEPDADPQEAHVEDPDTPERPQEILGDVCYTDPEDEPLEMLGEIEYVGPAEDPEPAAHEVVGRIGVAPPTAPDDAWENWPGGTEAQPPSDGPPPEILGATIYIPPTVPDGPEEQSDETPDD